MLYAMIYPRARIAGVIEIHTKEVNLTEIFSNFELRALQLMRKEIVVVTSAAARDKARERKIVLKMDVPRISSGSRLNKLPILSKKKTDLLKS